MNSVKASSVRAGVILCLLLNTKSIIEEIPTLCCSFEAQGKIVIV